MYVLFAFSYWQEKVPISFKHHVAKVTASFLSGLLQKNLKLSKSLDDIFMNTLKELLPEDGERWGSQMIGWVSPGNRSKDSGGTHTGHFGQAQWFFEFCLDCTNYIFSLKSGTMWWGWLFPLRTCSPKQKSLNSATEDIWRNSKIKLSSRCNAYISSCSASKSWGKRTFWVQKFKDSLKISYHFFPFSVG